jgi:hypothetical protein
MRYAYLARIFGQEETFRGILHPMCLTDYDVIIRNTKTIKNKLKGGC